MATHPVEHDDTQEPESDGEAPNPARLPVEPEFGQQLPASQGEDQAPRPPPI